MLSEIAAQLGIDQTFYVQFILVVLFYFLISSLYLKPFQRLLALREERTTGAVKEAQALTQKAEELQGQYKARLQDVHQKSRAILKKAEDESKLEAGKVLDAAAQDARGKVQTTLKELEKQKAELMTALSSDSRAIAQEIVSKVLNRA
jgi:F0F1-type ATP synthase membrane subunit b/b'